MRKSRRKFIHDTGLLAAGLAIGTNRLGAATEMGLGIPPSGGTGKSYYIDTAGDNRNGGASTSQPWKDFTNVNTTTFAPGDSILLKRGCVWNEELKINGAGRPNQFITIAAYGTGDRPKIQRDRKPSDRCMRLNNSSYVKVSGLEVCNGGAGIVLFYDHSYNNRSVYLDDIVAHDFMGLLGGQPDRVTWSSGICVTGVEDTPNNQTRVLSDLKITNTEVYNTGAGIALDWGNHTCVDRQTALSNKFGDVLMERLNVHDNTVECIAFVSLFLSSVTGCTIKDSIVDKGAKYASSGTSAVQIMFTKNLTLSNVTISNTPFNPCPDNTGLDFECDNENPVIDGCTFKNNAGPAIEILATPGFANPFTRNFEIKNCTFIGNNFAHKLGRYQISVADFKRGNSPTGKIYNNKYSNAPNTVFFGGDGNTTQIELTNNTNIGQPESEAAAYRSWKFDRDQGWRNGPYSNGISNLHVNGGSITGTITGIDPNIVSADHLGLPIGPDTFVRLVMKNGSSAPIGQIYFLTDADGTWNEQKHRDFYLHPEQAGFVTYDIDMSAVPGWKGTLRMLRVDPEQGAPSGTFSIQSVQILKR